jgi:hypothetical protein
MKLHSPPRIFDEKTIAAKSKIFNHRRMSTNRESGFDYVR